MTSLHYRTLIEADKDTPLELLQKIDEYTYSLLPLDFYIGFIRVIFHLKPEFIGDDMLTLIVNDLDKFIDDHHVELYEARNYSWRSQGDLLRLIDMLFTNPKYNNWFLILYTENGVYDHYLTCENTIYLFKRYSQYIHNIYTI